MCVLYAVPKAKRSHSHLSLFNADVLLYISEQRWMQLIDCDAAINYSCNRSVMESNPSTDRHRWMFKGCRHSCIFFSHSGNAFIPTITFSFRLLHVRTLFPPHAPPALCLPAPYSPFVLERTTLSSSDIKGSRSKCQVACFSCERLLQPNRLDDVCFCPASWE